MISHLKSLTKPKMSTTGGEGHPKALAGLDQDRSARSTEFVNSKAKIYDVNNRISDIVFMCRVRGEYINQRMMVEPVSIFENNSLVVDKVEPMSFPIRRYMKDGLRTWILTGSDTLKTHFLANPSYRRRRVCVLDRYIDKEKYEEGNSFYMFWKQAYMDVLNKFSFLLDPVHYPIIVCGMDPKSITDTYTANDPCLPALSMSKSSGHRALKMETGANRLAAIGAWSMPVTSSKLAKHYFSTTNNDYDRTYMTTSYSVRHIEDTFEACSGSEDIVADASYTTSKLDGKRQYLQNCHGKNGGKKEILERVARMKKVKKNAMRDAAKMNMCDAKVNAMKDVKTYDDVYEKALRHLTILGRNSSIAESCSGSWDFGDVGIFLANTFTDALLVDKCGSLVEQMALLFVTCKHCTSLVGIASAISLWLTTRYSRNKSCLKGGYRALCNLMGSSQFHEMLTGEGIDDIEDMLCGFGRESSVPSVSSAESEDYVSAGGELDMSQIGLALNSATFISETETMQRMREFVGTIADLGMCSIFDFTFDFSKLNVGFSKFMFCSKFYDSIVGHITYFVDRAWTAYVDGDPWVFLGRDSTADLLNQVQNILHIVACMEQGAAHVDTATIDSLIFEGEEINAKLAKAISTVSGPAKAIYVRSRSLCLDMLKTLQRTKQSGQSGVPAFGFLVSGPTSMGKTAVVDFFTKGMAAMFSNNTSANVAQTVLATEKFDQFLPGYDTLIMEEMAAENPDKVQEATFMSRIFRVINPARIPSYEAVAERKGTLTPVYKWVWGLSNTKTFDVSTYASHPAAVLRRFKFYISVIADTKYCGPNGLLDTRLVDVGVDPWLITLQYVEVLVNRKPYETPTEKYTKRACTDDYLFKNYSFEGKEMVNVDINTAFRCISSEYERWLKSENKLVDTTRIFTSYGICPHKTPYTYCKEPECIVAKEKMLIDGAKEQASHDILLKQSMEKFHKQSFKTKMADKKSKFKLTQSCVGDDEDEEEEEKGVGEQKEGLGSLRRFWAIDPRAYMDRGQINSLNTIISRSGLTGVTLQAVNDVLVPMGARVTEHEFESARVLFRWHTEHASEQNTKYFQLPLHKQDDLMDKWNSLDNTVFCAIRAPYMAGSMSKTSYHVQKNPASWAIRRDVDRSARAVMKKDYEIARDVGSFMEWRKGHYLMSLIIEPIIVRLGISVDKDSVLLSGICRLVDGMEKLSPIPVSLLCILVSAIFAPWCLLIIIPLVLVFMLLKITATIYEVGVSYMSIFSPSNVLRVSVSKARYAVSHKYAKVGAAVVSSLVAGRIAYGLFFSGDKKKKSVSCGSTVSVPVDIRPGYMNAYQKVEHPVLRNYSAMGPNNTLEQALSVVEQAQFIMRMSQINSSLGDGKVSYSNCLRTGMFIVTNKHVLLGLLNGDDSDFMEIEVIQSKNIKPFTRCKIVKKDIEVVNADLAIVRLTTIVPGPDLLKKGSSLFPEKVVDQRVFGTWIWRRPDMTMEKEIVELVPSKVSYVDVANDAGFDFDGFKYKVKNSIRGHCMAAVVTHSTPFMIAALHVAGRVGTEDVCGIGVSRLQIVDAIDRYDQRNILCSATVGTIDCDPYQTGLYKLAEITPKAAINFIPVDQPQSNLLVHGQIPGMVNARVRCSPAKYTTIGRVLEEKHPEMKYSLPVNLGPRGMISNLRECASMGETGDRECLDWATNSYANHLLNTIDKIEEENPDIVFSDVVHEVPLKSAFNDSTSGFNTIDLTKAVGHGLSGKKRDHMKDPIVREDGTEFLEPTDEVISRVEGLKRSCLEKIMPQTIFMGSLKRELMLEEKCSVEKPFRVRYTQEECTEPGDIFIEEILNKKVRFFAGCTFAYLILCKMMFGMLLRFFTLFAVDLGMAFGVNPHCYDFTVLVEQWLARSRNIIAGDYKKFDKKLHSAVTSKSTEVIIRLLQRAGFSRDQLIICTLLLYEVVYPTYLWGGVVVTAAQTTPSGHPLTAFKNNMDNQICIRYCWARVFKTLGYAMAAIPDFDENVVLNSMGDDHIGTVSPQYVCFNMQSIAYHMPEIGMFYTAANKSALGVELYESFDEIEYLKMRAKYDDELEAYKPLLNEASIYKMVMRTLAEYAEGSVDMETHTLLVMKDALIGMYYYGEERYNQFVEEMRECVALSTFKYTIPSFPSYEDQKRAYKVRLLESNSVRFMKDFKVPDSWKA